jgi:hypothetical protein
MSCYKSSIEALQQLLHLGTSDRKIDDKKKNSLAGCQITKTSNEISYMRNGIEYCFVEVTCGDGTQYGLQAYGEEANRLYKEAYRCIMCGSPPREPKRSAIVEESIDGKNYVFDSNGCALIFRRLRNVMGEESVAILA